VLLVNSRECFDDEVFCCKDETANVNRQHLTTSAVTNDVRTGYTDCNVPELRTSADGDSGQQGCLDNRDVTDGSSREPWTSSADGSEKNGVGCSASDLALSGQKDQVDYEKQLEENEVGDVVDQLQQPGSCRKIDVGASGTLSSSPPTGHMLMSARRIPKAAVALLRFPYDSIRRELDSTGTSGGDENSPGLAETPPLAQTTSASSSSTRTDAATVPATATDSCATPPATAVHQGGLMSRTLGSISSLPSSLVDLSSSLFVRGSGSDGGAPSPPRTALLDKTTAGTTSTPGGGGAAGERSPGPTHSSPRTFLFQPLERLVWGSKAGQGDAETADSGALPNDGKSTV
jgi:hypothetical protein